MSIHAYEHYIQHTNDASVKAELPRFQKEHKYHAGKTAERIQNLRGQAVENNGMMLSVQEAIMDIKGYPTSTRSIQ